MCFLAFWPRDLLDLDLGSKGTNIGLLDKRHCRRHVRHNVVYRVEYPTTDGILDLQQLQVPVPKKVVQPSKLQAQTKNLPFRNMRILSIATLSLVATSVHAFTSRSSTSIRAFSRLNMAASQEELKKQVGYKAVDDYVQSGMVVGLGTGSTAYYAVERVGNKLKSGELKDILAIPTSVRTKEQAEELGIPLVTLNTHSKLDVAIDGADEVDPDLNLVKGGGGALLREKMVEIMADKFIVIGTCVVCVLGNLLADLFVGPSMLDRHPTTA